MKKIITVITFFLIVASITSCSTVKVTNKNLGGSWDIVFTGDLTGLGKFYISGGSNTFSSGNISLTNVELSSYADYTISGEISTNVIVKGYVKQSGKSIGKIEGTFTIDNGAGAYTVNDSLEGGWTASK
jgi:hypothetical protein